jgi:SAM-dependent methyltransferase
MTIIKKLELKIFDINAHSLRGVNFYKSILDYRERIFPKLKHKIKADNQFECTLCRGGTGLEFIQWKRIYKLFECQDCGAVSPNIDNLSEDYVDSVYGVEEYKEKFMRETHSQYNYRKNNFGRERFEYTIDRLGLNKDSNVLDLGCGAGYYIATLHDAKIQYKGLEVADHLVDYCKSQHGLNVEKTDLEDERDGSYDLITMFDVLEHLPDPIKTLNVINKVTIQD